MAPGDMTRDIPWGAGPPGSGTIAKPRRDMYASCDKSRRLGPDAPV